MLQMASNETCDRSLWNVIPRNYNKLPCIRRSAVWTYRAGSGKGAVSRMPSRPNLGTAGFGKLGPASSRAWAAGEMLRAKICAGVGPLASKASISADTG